jgi:hypothetical protein
MFWRSEFEVKNTVQRRSKGRGGWSEPMCVNRRWVLSSGARALTWTPLPATCALNRSVVSA